MRTILFALLRFLGKGERKVVAVFGFTPQACHSAVLHLRSGAPELPVLLFSQMQPLPETVALCQGVFIRRNPLALLFCAQRQLWPNHVALGVATWTGERGHGAVKSAPFLIPPFRVVVMNSQSDFFPGTFRNVLQHFRCQLSNHRDA